ncbi:AAA family ATPase [Nannocystis sp. ILAH1]|uniref:AAA family ATPase n=1 Tax=Nannocystis sp. ILAH1 TaxID=2996789 RepID=UPI00226F6B32|nr:AAA family ATPase [Nannocystis sp. ILAH1]MCY0989450.1 AAA family ATPase [Nannocystis sp. ILAH1]
MRVLSLDLENIGPFDEAHIEFLAEAPNVTFITGENGTGKTVVLDAIRGLFGGHYTTLERKIWRDGVPFRLQMSVLHDSSGPLEISTRSGSGKSDPGFVFGIHPHTISQLPVMVGQGYPETCPNWVVDFWRSDLAHDDYDITSLVTPEPKDFLKDALSGRYLNAAATAWLCFFDYLRDSRDQSEKAVGEVLFESASKIVASSLLDGVFSHIERRTLTPIVRQNGHLVPLRNLSSGNAYLIQRLLSILGKMYSVHVLRRSPPKDLCNTPGLLLMDEAENHLHPRWQKRLISKILSIFPNLQIIATTHSPFLLASVAGARVFVCGYDRVRATCTIEDASDQFAIKPIDEILISPAFGYTQPFSAEITRLLEDRKTAAERGDEIRRRQIELELMAKNPDHFAYLEIDQRLRTLTGETQ